VPDQPKPRRRRWRFYRTASGHEPVKDFLLQLSQDDRVEVAAAMKEVEVIGLGAARHLRGDIYEVRTSGVTQNFRILFATQGQYSQILLALEAFAKKTQKTPLREITLAESRLADWNQRAT
jgi:phage-related protein